ncbi:hypothetical protein TRVL_08175 [Trypanosoma vivax]|nr:hypothetical protein TRVL_08175 [Trypanosoma vivax]
MFQCPAVFPFRIPPTRFFRVFRCVSPRVALAHYRPHTCGAYCRAAPSACCPVYTSDSCAVRSCLGRVLLRLSPPRCPDALHKLTHINASARQWLDTQATKCLVAKGRKRATASLKPCLSESNGSAARRQGARREGKKEAKERS